MTILIQRTLREAIERDLNEVVESDPRVSRDETIAAIVLDLLKCGEAQRYIRADGRIGYKPSKLLLRRWAEEEAEAELEQDDDL